MKKVCGSEKEVEISVQLELEKLVSTPDSEGLKASAEGVVEQVEEMGNGNEPWANDSSATIRRLRCSHGKSAVRMLPLRPGTLLIRCFVVCLSLHLICCFKPIERCGLSQAKGTNE